MNTDDIFYCATIAYPLKLGADREGCVEKVSPLADVYDVVCSASFLFGHHVC